MKSNFDIVKDFVPEQSFNLIRDWFEEEEFELGITRHRTSKYGDFRPGNRTNHKITVNGTLNAYSFLITLTHEFAHLLVWNQWGNKVKPHGKEWKLCFAELLTQLVNEKVFPDALNEVVIRHTKSPKASSVRDKNLIRELRRYDDQQSAYIFLDELEEGTIFTLNGKRTFKKGKKQRTRYLCHKIRVFQFLYL